MVWPRSCEHLDATTDGPMSTTEVHVSLAQMREDKPLLVEHRKDAFGEYEERWMVAPPPEDATYRVLDDGWDDDFTVRTIRRFELLR